MNGNRIRHMVVFSLKHPLESAETEQFLHDAERILASIPVVEGFEVLRQYSQKNNYHFGFSMEFADQTAYDKYNSHPDHKEFVKQRWETEVERFMEIDFKPYK